MSKTTFPCLIRPDDVKVAVKPAAAKSAETAAAEKAAAAVTGKPLGSYERTKMEKLPPPKAAAR